MIQRLALFVFLVVASGDLHADATTGTKELTKKITDQVHSAPMKEKDYTDLCERIMSDTRAKRMMCEMLLKDPEARQFLKLK